jgi:hypothetical protein
MGKAERIKCGWEVVSCMPACSYRMGSDEVGSLARMAHFPLFFALRLNSVSKQITMGFSFA